MYQIIQGGKAIIPIRLTDQSTGDPYDFSPVTEIKTCFQNSDGTELMVTKTGGAITVVGNPILGKLQIALTAAQTALLNEVDAGTLELAITVGSSDPFKFWITGAYSVSSSQC